MQRAYATSIAVLLIGVIAHFFVLGAFSSAALALVLGGVVLVLAGTVAAYLAPRMKLLVGAGVAVPAAVLLAIGDVIFGSLGHYGNWPGPLNSLLAGIVVLPVGLLLCSIGGWIGAKYSMAKADA